MVRNKGRNFFSRQPLKGEKVGKEETGVNGALAVSKNGSNRRCEAKKASGEKDV
jgi:hypothetical protein